MSAPPPGSTWLPRQGPVQGTCESCRTVGSLVVEHRMVWGQLGVIPVDAPQVAHGCPECGHQGDPELGSRLVAKTDPPASLAGMMPKLAATDCTWLECPRCGYDAPAQFWVWVRCTAQGCSRESRGKLV